MTKQRNAKKQKRRTRTAAPVPSLEVLRSADLINVPHLPLVEPAFTHSSLRWHLFHRKTNGLLESGAVVEFGRKLMVRPKLFRAWVEAHCNAVRPA